MKDMKYFTSLMTTIRKEYPYDFKLYFIKKIKI